MPASSQANRRSSRRRGVDREESKVRVMKSDCHTSREGACYDKRPASIGAPFYVKPLQP